MTKRYLISALLAFALSLILFKPIAAQPKIFAQNPASDALALIDAVNALRIANNLQPYHTSDILMSIAQSHAEHIAQTGFLSKYERGLAPYQRAIEARYPVAGDLVQGGLFAENIDLGKNLSPADLIKKWQNDSVNRAALLSADFEDIGVGVAVDGGLTYYVLDVGAALDDPALWYTSTPTPSGVVITNTPLEDGTIYHIVQPKEVLWSIALAYSITVDDLKRLNKLTTDEIYENQKLLVYKPKPEEVKTPTPGVTFTATFGIPTSTATQPIEPTIASTATPLPVPPASPQSGGVMVGIIVLIALLGAGVGSWLGSRKNN